MADNYGQTLSSLGVASIGLAAQDDPTATPDFTTKAYQQMARAWEYIAGVTGGTLRLRECPHFLPQFPAERDESYKIRRTQATFLNIFNKTLAGYAGLVFRQDPELAEDNPEEILALWENIDNAGTHGTVFLKEVFDSAARYGHAAILVEYPENYAEDAAQEIALELRPYWTLREASQILNWRTGQENGRTVLQQITFREVTCEASGTFGEQEVIRYRVYARDEGVVTAQVWQEFVDERGRKAITPINEPVFLPMSEIPVAFVYGKKTGLLTSQPPLLDLALVNLRHYQDYSDYRTGKQKAALIVPYAIKRTRRPEVESGAAQDTIVIGFDSFVDLDEGGGFGFAEPNGSALDAHRIALEDTKREMAWLGLAALMPSGQGVTTKSAEEAAMDNAASTSELATMARSLQDGAELALQFTGEYLGVEAGSLEMGVAWQDLILTVEQQRLFYDMQQAGSLSLNTLWQIFDRAHLLGEEFDAAVEQQQLSGVDVIPTMEQ